MWMTQVSVVAVKDFEFNGAVVHEGDTLDVRPIEAAALTYQKKAVFPQQYRTRAMVAEPTARPRRRRNYKRRDMTAESS